MRGKRKQQTAGWKRSRIKDEVDLRRGQAWTRGY